MAIPVPKLVVTPNDYFNFFGEDLKNLLQGADNDSNYPNVVLRLVQDFLEDWCDEHGFRRLRYQDLNPRQAACFQKAVLYQTYYLAHSGGLAALGLDSGYSLDHGIVLSADQRKSIAVPDRVVELLHKSGMFNLKIKNRPRISRGYPGVGPNLWDDLY